MTKSLRKLTKKKINRNKRNNSHKKNTKRDTKKQIKTKSKIYIKRKNQIQKGGAGARAAVKVDPGISASLQGDMSSISDISGNALSFSPGISFTTTPEVSRRLSFLDQVYPPSRQSLGVSSVRTPHFLEHRGVQMHWPAPRSTRKMNDLVLPLSNKEY